MKSAFLVTIGLEVHVQLATRTKIFCGCPVQFGIPPNTNVCPVCLGLPGVLPVLNREVFRLGLRAVLALGGTPSKIIKFDRKNYFYPDLPKGYQISQYDNPLGRGGLAEVDSYGIIKKIRLNRIHLEEDAGKLVHDQSPDTSYVDLNRAGTPLIEIVSEPEIESSEQAYKYLANLKSILKAIKVSECDMEKGHLRCDANVSVRKSEADVLGKKVEIKNLNSFKAIKAALNYEINRQGEALEKGEAVIQETRLWDESRKKTFSMRSKEEAHDYRYFPEPDLLPFYVSLEEVLHEENSLPELPRQKTKRFIEEYQLTPYYAGVLTLNEDTAKFYEDCAKLYENYYALANWMANYVFQHLNSKGIELSQTRLTPENFVKLCRLVDQQRVSFQAAKDKILADVIENGSDPEKVLGERGLEQVSDKSPIEEWIEEVVQENPKVVSDFKSGKDTAVMFLVGQVMRKSRGKANPTMVQELIRKKFA